MTRHQIQELVDGVWQSVLTVSTQDRAISLMAKMIRTGDYGKLRVVAV